jgi:hypothetical protein
MYFLNNENKLNIQGEGYFNTNNRYPLGVTVSSPGNVTFTLDGLENFPSDQEVYIYDTIEQTYTSIKNEPFTVNLTFGNHDNRFELRFYNPNALGVIHNDISSGITITHSMANNVLTIKNATIDATVKAVALYNLVGQNILNTTITSKNQSTIEVPFTNINTGAYIVKVITDKGQLTKKIVIQ